MQNKVAKATCVYVGGIGQVIKNEIDMTESGATMIFETRHKVKG
jgi:hypothetical protein